MPTPQVVTALAGIHVVAVSASGYHSLAVSDDGRVFAWGWNGEGQVGTGSIGGPTPTPQAATGLAGVHVAAVAAGWRHSLAVTADGCP